MNNCLGLCCRKANIWQLVSLWPSERACGASSPMLLPHWFCWTYVRAHCINYWATEDHVNFFKFLPTPPRRMWIIKSACLCLSDCSHISNSMCLNFINFFVHVINGCGLILSDDSDVMYLWFCEWRHVFHIMGHMQVTSLISLALDPQVYTLTMGRLAVLSCRLRGKVCYLWLPCLEFASYIIV